MIITTLYNSVDHNYVFKTESNNNNLWQFHFLLDDIKKIQTQIAKNFEEQYIHFNVFSMTTYGPAISIAFDREEDENFFKVMIADGIEI